MSETKYCKIPWCGELAVFDGYCPNDYSLSRAAAQPAGEVVRTYCSCHTCGKQITEVDDRCDTEGNYHCYRCFAKLPPEPSQPAQAGEWKPKVGDKVLVEATVDWLGNAYGGGKVANVQVGEHNHIQVKLSILHPLPPATTQKGAE